jgi:hypothetical protein
MPVSDDHQLLMVHIPKNAGTSIQEELGMRLEGHHDYSWYRRRHPSLWESCVTFCVSRNPFDRAVSCYEYAIQEESYWHSASNPDDAAWGKHPDYDRLEGLSFKEALRIIPELKHQGWRPQHPWVCRGGDLMVDTVLRMESLAHDFRSLCGEDLPVLNRSREGRDWRSYYDDEALDLVRAYYVRDFEIFDYSALPETI